jgi:hypothetical protein
MVDVAEDEAGAIELLDGAIELELGATLELETVVDELGAIELLEGATELDIGAEEEAGATLEEDGATELELTGTATVNVVIVSGERFPKLSVCVVLIVCEPLVNGVVGVIVHVPFG